MYFHKYESDDCCCILWVLDWMIECETWGAYTRSVSLIILCLQPLPNRSFPSSRSAFATFVGFEINAVVLRVVIRVSLGRIYSTGQPTYASRSIFTGFLSNYSSFPHIDAAVDANVVSLIASCYSTPLLSLIAPIGKCLSFFLEKSFPRCIFAK